MSKLDENMNTLAGLIDQSLELMYGESMGFLVNIWNLESSELVSFISSADLDENIIRMQESIKKFEKKDITVLTESSHLWILTMILNLSVKSI